MSSNADHPAHVLSQQVKALSNSQRDALVAVLTLKQHELLTMVAQHADNPGAVKAFVAVMQSVNALVGLATSTSVRKRGKNPRTDDPAVVEVTETFQNMLSAMAEEANPEGAARNAALEAEMQALVDSGVDPRDALSQMIRKADSPEYAAAQAQVEAHRSSAGDGLDGLYL